MASVGHIRDLPKKLGVDIENGFQEEYEISPAKEKVVKELKAAAKTATELVLATDPDREGEAISWHLLEAIKPPKTLPVSRVLFNEITPAGIQKAMAAPTTINKKLVDAQRARRVLDRLVGYKVSQVLWDKVRRGLSAGRVQSVAVRIIVDREKEILAFNPVEYWVLKGRFAAKLPPSFWMRLVKLGGQPLQLGNKETKRRVGDAAQAKDLKTKLEKADYKVTGLETKEKKRNPAAPFTTAKLQQESAQKLKMSVSRTMQNAQRLYEGVDFGEGPVGLITYMRTDSPRMAPEAVEATREFIASKYGKEFLPAKARVHRQGRGAGRARGHPPHGHHPHAGIPARAPGARPVPPLRADLAADDGLADGGRALRRDRGADRGRSGQGHGHLRGQGRDRALRGLAGGVPRRQDRGGSRGHRRCHQGRRRGGRGRRAAAGPEAGRGAEARAARRGPAVHQAPRPLQRGHAGEGAGGGRHRPALHLRQHHQHHPGPRLRQEARGPLQAHGSRHDGHRAAAAGLPRPHGSQVPRAWRATSTASRRASSPSRRP